MKPADLDLLLQLRLAVARVGETDLAKWWGTDGVLGPSGAFVYERIAPRTAPLARARVVFATARSRCAELLPATNVTTLWALPAEIEEAFEDRWVHWLEEPAAWRDTLQAVENLTGGDLLAVLTARSLVSEALADRVRGLDASPPSVEIPAPATLDADALCLLAAAFACGRTSSPIVPFYRLAA